MKEAGAGASGPRVYGKTDARARCCSRSPAAWTRTPWPSGWPRCCAAAGRPSGAHRAPPRRARRGARRRYYTQLANAPPTTAPDAPTTSRRRCSRARWPGAAPGCHLFAAIMEQPERHVESMSPLGGEGVAWIGLTPFTDWPTWCRTRATAPCSTPATWASGSRRRRRHDDLPDPVQRRRRQHRRAGGGRRQAGARADAAARAGGRHADRGHHEGPDGVPASDAAGIAPVHPSRGGHGAADLAATRASPSSSTTASAPTSAAAARAARRRSSTASSSSTRRSARAAGTAARSPTACRCTRWTPSSGPRRSSTRPRATRTPRALAATAPRS